VGNLVSLRSAGKLSFIISVRVKVRVRVRVRIAFVCVGESFCRFVYLTFQAFWWGFFYALL